jgi:hypothetical protein
MTQQTVDHPDLRDQRGHGAPGVWPKGPNTPHIERCPTGGMVDPSVYHDRGHFDRQPPQTQPLPLTGK